MNQNIQKLILLISLLTIAFFYSIFYSHSDLNHTAISSYAILNGHINDFYEFNKIKMGANDYLPLIYWVFAIWNFPFCKFLIDCNTAVILTPGELIVQKLLLAALFGFSIRILNLIAKEVTNSKGAVVNCTLFYSTSAVMLFCIFAFNQYDIVGIVLSLYGILLFLRNKLIRFSLLFSAAISVKYFAAVAFFPILLIVEKRISRIILYCFIAASTTLIQIYLYRDSPAFLGSFYALALKKVSAADGISSLSSGLVSVGIYLIILLSSWLYKPADESHKLRACVIASIAAYLTLYLKVDWHPQWICIIIPYLALSSLYSKNIKINIFFQLILSGSYLLLVVSKYPNNLDNFLLGAGFFGDYFGYSHIPIVTMYKFVNFAWVSWCFYLSIVYFLHEAIASKHIENSAANFSFQTAAIWASNLIFIIPSLVIAFSTPTFLSRYDETAALRNRNVVKVVNGGVKGSFLGNINTSDQVVQFFRPELPNMTAISLIFGTYHKVSNSVIKFDIYTKNDSVFSAILDFTKIYPNMLTTIENIDVGNRCNDGCYFSLKVVSGDLPLELWHEIDKNHPYSKYFIFNGKKINGSFIIEEFYKR